MNYPRVTLHNHTVFCDGKNTVEEMVKSAVSEGIQVLGFSGHSHLPFAPDWTMSKQGTEEYVAEIRRLQKLYEGRLDIRLGIEWDSLSQGDRSVFDYAIGSVHHVEKDGEIFSLDLSKDAFVTLVEEHYGGDYLALAADYYESLADFLCREEFDIIGHFDLITKYNEGNALFDADSLRYRTLAIDALDAVLEKDALFEINTGAMARGYRKAPYPAPFLLRRIAEKGGRVILSGDCHAADKLLFGFETAADYAESCGVRALWRDYKEQ